MPAIFHSPACALLLALTLGASGATTPANAPPPPPAARRASPTPGKRSSPPARIRRASTVGRPASAATATLPKPKSHVWTAQDIASLRGAGRTSVMGGAAPAAETSDGTALAPKAAAQQDAGAWRATADRLRNTIASAQAGIAQLDAVDEQWRSLVLGTDGYEREAAHDLAEHQRQRAALEQQLTQSQGELAQLEEQARKSGVEPGALR